MVKKEDIEHALSLGDFSDPDPDLWEWCNEYADSVAVDGLGNYTLAKNPKVVVTNSILTAFQLGFRCGYLQRAETEISKTQNRRKGGGVTLDIGSGNAYPAGALSNFSPHPFVLDGINIASMEGFLQGLKFSNPDKQVQVCGLVGKKAKFTGKRKRWQRDGKLWWRGKEVDRYSQEYQDLLDRAYVAMFDQNESARKALLASGNAVFRHSTGKNKQSDTVLTVSEFCSRLTKNRARLVEWA